MKKEYLFSPGPTPVPPEVLLEMAKPIFHHRTARFREMFGKVTDGLRKVLLTDSEILTLAGSGTAAMEAALANTVSAGGKVLVVQGGKFGERWGELAKAFGLKATILDTEWGEAVDPGAIEKALKDEPGIEAVFVTYCETSTAVKTDVEPIGKIVASTDAILVVDGISAVPAMEMRTDEWKVDILVIGSQKALMLPPGLAFLTLSEKAARKVDIRARGYYLNLAAYRKSMGKTDTPYTPAVTLIRALDRSLDMILDYGVENLWRDSALMARATREAAKAMGLEVFSKSPADAVTAIRLPEGIEGDKVPALLRDDYGITLAGGQAKLKGRIVRIAHMGFLDRFETLTVIAALEDVLVKMGVELKRGAGLARAWEVMCEVE